MSHEAVPFSGLSVLRSAGWIAAACLAVGCSEGGPAGSGDDSVESAAASQALTTDSALAATITPHNTPVVLPPTGGNFDYDVHLVNTADESAGFDVWTELRAPDGTLTSPVFGPVSFALPGGWSSDRMLSHGLSGDVAPGVYTYTLNAGTYPATVDVAASFDVEKTAEQDANGWIAQVYDNPYPVLSSIYFVDDQHGWIAGSRNTLLATDDGGDNWYPQTSPTSSNYGGIHFVDADNGWAVGTNGRIVHTTDGGGHWENLPKASSYYLNTVFFTDANTGWVAGGKPRSFTSPRAIIMHTTDGGSSWTFQLSRSDVTPLIDLNFVDPSHGWAVGDAGWVYATVNGGASWALQSTGVTASLKGVWFVDRDHGWAVGTNGTVIHTSNGGLTWTVQDTGVGSGYTFSAVRFVSTSEGWISGGSGTTGAILHTENGGATWRLQEVGEANYLYDLAFTDAQNGWAAGLYGTILHTETGGR